MVGILVRAVEDRTRVHPRYPALFGRYPDVHFGSRECAFCYAVHTEDPDTAEEQPIAERFAELAQEWRHGTGGVSSPREIASHPAYRQIIALGESVLPLIFKDLERNGGWWYPALRALTGENPVQASARGRPPLSNAAWLQWGRQNGYL